MPPDIRSGFAGFFDWQPANLVYAGVAVKIPWQTYLSELIGTALLVGVGLSVVIFDFGTGSPVVTFLPDAGLRRLITGFLFGATGAAIAYSTVGKISGAHINPVVTLALPYSGQVLIPRYHRLYPGAVRGRHHRFGPPLALGTDGPQRQFWRHDTGDRLHQSVPRSAEKSSPRFGLIVGLFILLSHRKFRRYTPLLFPVLYAVMVYLEAPVSGTSTNPARSLGPSLISGVWTGWWIYFAGPLIGMFVGVGLCRFSWPKRFEVEIAKIYHFQHDRYGIFQPARLAQKDPARAT